MSRSQGNVALKAARQAAGFGSQQALADAMNQEAPRLGIRGIQVSVRTVRRWESEAPGWPDEDHQRLLTHLLAQTMEQLGFTPPWAGAEGKPARRALVVGAAAAVGAVAVPGVAAAQPLPVSIGSNFAAVTTGHRAMYWSVPPSLLHPAVAEHARLGAKLLPQTVGTCHVTLAAALAESLLLSGRIEFFDLQQPERAEPTFVEALQAAAHADDDLLGSAIIAHSAFIPGWAGRREDATERMTAARTYARRGPASAEFWAWLDAVEAECETRCGSTQTALHLIGHAEDVLAEGNEHPNPAWMDWFSPIRLAAFKGNTQLEAGHLPQARETLRRVLEQMPETDGKQRTVILGDLASVEAAAHNPDAACDYAVQALDQLSLTWYATGMDRVREVRRKLTPWQGDACVRDLDDRLYGWHTTLSALQR
jgi:hypothetical protein